MKKAITTILIILGISLLLPADSLAGSASTDRFPQFGYPQDNGIRFERISVEAGLSQSTVTCILQDSVGYIWFGTRDGLNRYNGYEFTIFEHDPTNSLSLSNNVILSLYEGRDGILWIGTEGGGLNQYDPKIGEMTHYDLDSAIQAIYEDGDGILWLGTDSGIVKLDLQTGDIVHAQNHLIDNELVLAIIEDQWGVYWVGTSSGLVRYDPSDQSYNRYRNDPTDHFSLSGNVVNSMYEDSAGILWIGTDNGLSGFDRTTENFSRYRRNPNQVQSLGDNVVTTIFEDREGILWIGTQGGLDQLDRETEAFTHYNNDPANPFSLSSENVLAVYEDAEGVLWVGTETGGINKAGFGRGAFTQFQSRPGERNSLSHNIVRAIYQEPDRSLWIGTADGLDHLDLNTGQYEHYEHDPSNMYGLRDDVILSVYGDREGRLWVGTLHGGLHEFDRQNGQFTVYQNSFRDPLTLSDNTVRVIYEDSEGHFWIGTNNGLNRFDRRTGLFNSYVYFKDIGNRAVRAITEDPMGVLWVGTDTGVYYYERTLNRFEPIITSDPYSGLNNSLVLSLYADENRNLWIGTFQNGLIKYDLNTFQPAYFRKIDGLPSDVVYGILGDEQGFLWLSTSRGLVRFDPEKALFTTFDITDGLQNNEYSEGAYYQNVSGDMYFGGISGLTAFDPQRIQDNEHIPTVVLTSLTQGGEPVSGDQPVEAFEKISFSWPKNFFEFEFAALSFQNTADNQYAYILEGFEDEWNQVGTKRFGRYTNLPGGKYSLRIIGSNNDGLWNEEGTSVEITIIPPFWETWWFILSLVVLLLGGVFGGYRWRMKSVETRSRQLESLVQTRTAELSRAFERLQYETDERQRAEEKLAQQAVESAVEEERNRLARDLHDAVTQTLFSASLIAEVLPRLWRRDETEGQRRLGELRELTRGALAEMRTLLLELRPAALLETSLGDLLTQLAESITGRARIPVSVEQEGECDLPSDVKIALYRIAQETLNNVVKHAPSSQADIHFRCQPNQVVLSIRDNGSGFDPASVMPECMGLGIMAERSKAVGATLEIKSQTGQGTEVKVAWPMLVGSPNSQKN
ncbi:MAG: hypothetical protein ISR58_04000 [Anaerolineales bacterium]|nr:hypothetical protein [Chloroflexota bacterium]MBL6980335.1 hypothetical protein [Anaerolineales bacterium]